MADTTDASASPAATACSALLAAAAAAGMTWFVATELPRALSSSGEAALVAATLVAAAGLGVLLCAYLALIWTMASLVLLVGPASRIGRALLTALRVLAPRVARRITLGAAVATTATGLALVPATAADLTSDQHSPGRIAVAATLTGTTPSGVAAPSPTGASGPTDPDPGPEAEPQGPPRPGLGWSGTGQQSEESGPAVPDRHGSGAAPGEREAGAAPDPTAAPQSSPQPPPTVEVRPGDSLWSITDDLLGPGVDDAGEVSALWPSLHDANRDVIGPDPDHLEPGQVLVVPADLSSQEH